MSKKKPQAKPGGKPKQPPSTVSYKRQFNRALLATALLVVIVVAAGLLAHFLVPPIGPDTGPATTPKQIAPALRKTSLPQKTPPRQKAPVAATRPRYEIYPKETHPPVRTLTSPPTIIPKERPKVSIIIDDMGYDRKMTRKFLQLNAVLTYSILPFSPLQEEIMAAARKNHLDTMLHLPMEPTEYPLINPGPGALLTDMTPDELIDQLKKNIRSMPGIKGINNHMGSRLTEISVQMYQIFSVVKKEKLFFIDSRTTAATLCKPSARLLRIPFAERDVFLDHENKPDAIRNQIMQLIQKATEKGEAIGIGHPHPATYRVLSEMLPELKRKVKLVPASEVVHLLG